MNAPNPHPMVKLLVILCGTFLTAFFVLFFGFHAPLQEEVRKLKKSPAHTESVELCKQGWTSMIGGKEGINYNLRSWDAGQTWYAVKVDWQTDTTPRKFTILGLADTVYPNLLKHLESWDRLSDYVQKNGAIGSKPITKDQIELLEGTGFTVEQNKK